MLARLVAAGCLLCWARHAAVALPDSEWQCPALQPVACSCDLPHTLRCVAERAALPLIARTLRGLPPEAAVSLLDCTVRNLTTVPGPLLEGVSLHGLVVSSGEIAEVSERAFVGLKAPLQALGLPNNQLQTVPNGSLRPLVALERLDLSHNRIRSLDGGSFKALRNLTFLDLNDNALVDVSPDAFEGCPGLAVLRVRGNRLAAATVAALRGLQGATDLDLSTNALVGPLTATSLPQLPSLRTLQLANNQLSSVRRGALTGASSLLTLSLNHNQIDVIEDDAFREVSSLRSLDLANNRIVAVSGASLAHLPALTELDLSHNFLRALTADLVAPLGSLVALRLDDNDISMVASGAPGPNTRLSRLTLADNPLNCDCTLAEFAVWFNNSSRLSMADRSTAVCVTPPALENALLMEIPHEDLRCGGEDEDSGPAPPEGPAAAHVPLSGAQVMLRAFHFDGVSITLLWSVDSSARPFSCDALFVYEEMAAHEVLLTSTPLRCNSSQLADPTALTVRLPSGTMQPAHRYRYCVVLLEGGKFTDEMQLVLGCSEVIPLVVTSQSVAQPPRLTSPTRIAALQANVSTGGLVTVTVQLWNQKKLTDLHCHITVTVFVTGALLAQHHLNCTQPRVTIPDLPTGPYHICATLGSYPPSEPRVQCITVKGTKLKPSFNVTLTVCFALLTSLVLLGTVLVFRKILKRPKMITTHQCFLAPSELEDQQHSRYVKLQATTKL